MQWTVARKAGVARGLCMTSGCLHWRQSTGRCEMLEMLGVENGRVEMVGVENCRVEMVGVENCRVEMVGVESGRGRNGWGRKLMQGRTW